MKNTNTVVIGGVKLVIGAGAAGEIGKEVAAQGATKVFVVVDQGIIKLKLHERVTASLKEAGISYKIFDEVPSDPPVSVVETGVRKMKETGCDSVAAIGGGSVMDAAKAINIMSTNEGSILDYDNSPSGGRKFQNPGYPLFTVPTTSGTGSEVTQYAVITSEKENRKAAIGDPKLVSKAAFLDPAMTMGLPQKITAATGMDALAHAIEAYTSNRVITAAGSSVFSDTYALKAMELIGKNLKQAYAQGNVMEARKQMMLGSTMAGMISQAGSGAAHGLGTPLGARYHVPHGVAVGMMLPYVMEYNLNACPERYKNIAAALGRNVDGMNLEDAARQSVEAVKSLLKATEFAMLRDFVKKEDEIDLLAADAEKDKCCQLNARLVYAAEAKELYKKAWNEK
ncbi:MAG: iron-containing alcohol dehydrogenase [Dorea sp.]|nr:iron-containing alcohol dehydrogenase [Dorea sp.]